MTPNISIVINSYNQSHYLKPAIESVLAQTYKDFELLIWDDGSTDDSVAVAREFAVTDSRIRVVAASHQGRGKALKAAIEATRGQYLAWVDRDDLLATTALEQTAAVLETHPHIGMVYTDYLDIDEAGNILQKGDRCRIPYSRDRLLTDFVTFHFRLLRRDTFDRAGGIDPAFEYAEDYDLCLRLSEITEIYHLPQPLYFYRLHRENTSRRHQTLQIARSKKAVENALERRHLSDTLKLDVVDGQFLLRPRPAVPFARVAAVLASLTIPLVPLSATAEPETPSPLENLPLSQSLGDGVTKSDLDDAFEGLKHADSPQAHPNQRIGRGYGGNGYGYGNGYGGGGGGYRNPGRISPPPFPFSRQETHYIIAPDGNIEFRKP
ncbi:glycosyltransferase [Baaleninema simplex]|uniref:glycosyltransferase n=1 Tax=Baaleninema simplex TaxID=2862350 RepID=UPI000348BCDD|nr:glycosyltransferase [Baaleninema simplex]